MSNPEIVEILELTAKLMELHGADPFKIKGYSIAAFYLDKYKEGELQHMTEQELTKLQGIGKSTAGKIVQIAKTGTFPELEDLLRNTPLGVMEMFNIKGIGPKKIAVLWQELGIDNLHELELACLNGTVAKLKGFGGSIQQKIIDSLAFLKDQAGKLRMDKAEVIAEMIVRELKKSFDQVEVAGDIRRRAEIVDTIKILVGTDSPALLQTFIGEIEILVQDEKRSSPFVWRGNVQDVMVDIEIVAAKPERVVNELFIETSDALHLGYPTPAGSTIWRHAYYEEAENEEVIYQKAGLPYIVPEMREGANEFLWAETHSTDQLITWDDLKGILHNHSTYSDGQHTLEQMALYCRELGFEYLGIADHSQTATYAQGLKIEDVIRQHEEIAKLNARFAAENPEKPFKILKGIESDILGDGSLDYPTEILASFDYIVASVHSNLTMTLEKATTRLLKAIENPYTTILGHPTGRLLLSREGYPIDHKAIIDACAERQVVVEINASPWRLDLDWRWISYCMEKGVLLSINPDAHSKEGYFDMHYGVAVARKGGLTKDMTFNAFDLGRMEEYLISRLNILNLK
ncbi:DNA polymerase/3'-5' exonuclease PolX [Dyadobacter fanqingshengii]|uniref:PHP domain-containing protein n=1 Tax=Dyadobacter fanqingshengii TaxID=2906443 RepID=A0A9X1TFX6_9BACT|nr:DNA polymerase/3'-5' exonuclease PolX [Dyadobacter fanqingshengii]MCF0039952.1 PHP domain-containing protein [Dyadobacter fanqingshengii]USJ38292.1 PHP domain-containing protein [Dyadobacter fanqingshengii]